jgi:hypothetical protein
VARHEAACLGAVGLERRRCNARDLGRFVKDHLARAELRRHEADQSGPRADVRDRRLAALDRARKRVVKGLIADVVGNQRAMIFDAHGALV